MIESVNPGIDNPDRVYEISELINKKPALKWIYQQAYEKYQACLTRCPKEGLVIELGSGASFAKKFIPDLITTDIIPYPNVDLVVDATNMPFEASSLRAIFMQNVFHHIPDVHKFLNQAIRCLQPGGRIFIIDQHKSVLSNIILGKCHNEFYDSAVESWIFESDSPLGCANGALAWIVFQRDYELFKKLYGQSLTLELYMPHSPFKYWLSGGLKQWSLLPLWLMPTVSAIDSFLSPSLACFVDIEILRL